MGTYEADATLTGEVRVYLETEAQIDVSQLKAQLAYRFCSERPHADDPDPWEYALADTCMLQSESEFFAERDRLVAVLLSAVRSRWEVEVLYHPPGQASAIFHWSSTEGTLHPYRTLI